MPRSSTRENIVYKLTRQLFAVPETELPANYIPRNILIIRQHNQLGDMLAGVSIFRGLKEKYPDSRITLIAGPQNYYAVEKNKFIDRLFVFNKKRLWDPLYVKNLWNILRNRYDIVIVPVTVSVSFTSNLISRFSDAAFRIGPSELNGTKNKSDFLFNIRREVDWSSQPDSNVAEIILDILKPLNVYPSTFKSEITFDKSDTDLAEHFVQTLGKAPSEKLIGLHVGAGKPQNHWSLKKYIEVIEELNRTYQAKFYFTGSRTDKDVIEYMRKNLDINAGYFLSRKIHEVAALISQSDLFITNDTGIMHVAGATETPQISIFGPTNPYNWAPLGKNKYFLRKSELIDDVETEDVLDLCKTIFGSEIREAKLA
jgi:ADP-heptose:LPS heptosyltransferase